MRTDYIKFNQELVSNGEGVNGGNVRLLLLSCDGYGKSLLKFKKNAGFRFEYFLIVNGRCWARQIKERVVKSLVWMNYFYDVFDFKGWLLATEKLFIQSQINSYLNGVQQPTDNLGQAVNARRKSLQSRWGRLSVVTGVMRRFSECQHWSLTCLAFV